MLGAYGLGFGILCFGGGVQRDSGGLYEGFSQGTSENLPHGPQVC